MNNNYIIVFPINILWNACYKLQNCEPCILNVCNLTASWHENPYAMQSFFLYSVLMQIGFEAWKLKNMPKQNVHTGTCNLHVWNTCTRVLNLFYNQCHRLGFLRVFFVMLRRKYSFMYGTFKIIILKILNI